MSTDVVGKEGRDIQATTHFLKSRKRNAVAPEQESPSKKVQKPYQDKSELDLAIESIAQQEYQLEPQLEETSHTRCAHEFNISLLLFNILHSKANFVPQKMHTSQESGKIHGKSD